MGRTTESSPEKARKERGSWTIRIYPGAFGKAGSEKGNGVRSRRTGRRKKKGTGRRRGKRKLSAKKKGRFREGLTFLKPADSRAVRAPLPPGRVMIGEYGRAHNGKRLREAEALRPGRDPVRNTGRGSPKGLVLLDLISGEKGCQNDGADQEGNHPVHVAHCFSPFFGCGSGADNGPGQG